MSRGGGYLTVANEAVALARRHPEYAGAILLLYDIANDAGWGPFDCADRWLTKHCSMTMRQADAFIRLMVQGGYLDIIDPGSNRSARMVMIRMPEAAERNLERSRERRPERRERTQDKPTTEATDDPPTVNGAHNGAQAGAQGGAIRVPSIPVPEVPVPLDIGAAVAAAVADPRLDVEVRIKAHKATPLVSDAWQAEFQQVFGVKYPWAWEGRDHDGSKLKRWLKQAKVDPADPKPGVDRLRNAFRAYFEAVQAGTAFPPGNATTKGFDFGIANWLQSTPNGARDGPSRTLDQAKQRWGFGGGT